MSFTKADLIEIIICTVLGIAALTLMQLVPSSEGAVYGLFALASMGYMLYKPLTHPDTATALQSRKGLGLPANRFHTGLVLGSVVISALWPVITVVNTLAIPFWLSKLNKEEA